MTTPLPPNLTCAKCAYTLTGIPKDAPCPECGAFARRLPSPIPKGFPPQSARWLKATRITLLCFVITTLAFAAVGLPYLIDNIAYILGYSAFIQPLLPPDIFVDESAYWCFYIALCITQILFLWPLTRPDPSGIYTGLHVSQRWLIRLAAIALTAVSFMLLLYIPDSWAYDGNPNWRTLESIPQYLDPFLEITVLFLCGRLARTSSGKKLAWALWGLALLSLACILVPWLILHKGPHIAYSGQTFVSFATISQTFSEASTFPVLLLYTWALLKLAKTLKPTPSP